MGEVWRARDPKIGRDVAIKVLPASLSENGDRLRRFEQEAQAAGALNHPNILVIYHIGTHGDAPYIVSELLEGETLSERLVGSAVPQRKAIDYATQIARGLAAAHEKGIVHRDVKPDNLFITRDDRVKILDFGIAKLVAPSNEGLGQTDVATRKVLTDPGSVVGTVGYMSPEQVRGQAVDHRSDIFSFGAVLYEMVSGRRAFRGESAIETLNAILKEEPAELTSTSPNVAPALERVVWHCLEKSPERRFQSASDIAFALESLTGVTSHPSQQTLASIASPRSSILTRERLIWLTACAVLLITAALFAFAYLSRSQNSAGAVRLSLTTPEKTSLPAHISVSPDGTRVVFVATNTDGKHLLWIRPLDSLTAQPLTGTDGASASFWSPDSHSIGFFANGKLYKMDAAGGRPQALCDVREDKGGSWNRDGIILFADPAGLQRVSAQGGTPVLATKVQPKEEAHRWPYFLPDGRHFVFLGDAPTTENHSIRLGSLDSQDTQILFSAVTRIVYSPPGYLLYVNQGALVAQPFDPGKLKTTGEPVTIAEHVEQIGDNHEFDFSASDNGVVAYRTGSSMSQLAWFDRTGKKLGPAGEPESYATFALSPDGQRAAVGLLDADGRQNDVWLLELSRGTKSRLTLNPQSEGDPVWSPDGTRIAFTSNRGSDGRIHMYTTSVSGAGDDELLIKEDADDIPSNWSSDGQKILFMRYGPNYRAGIWLLSLNGQREAKPLLRSPAFDQAAGMFSPNGSLVAYVSNESGRNEVYVQTFPRGNKTPISSGGGVFPMWRGDGKELFYITEDGRVMEAQIKSDAPFQVDVPQQLFQTSIKFGQGYPYAVNHDGSRFLIITPAEANNAAPLTVVLNWTASLKQAK